MRIIYLVLGCALFLLHPAHAQNGPQFRWAINGGSTDLGPLALTEKVQHIASDPHGNIYITSPVYKNNIKVAGVTLRDGHDHQFTDILLSSINCAGVHRWSKVIGGINGEEAPFIKVSPAGQVYLAGYVNKNNAQPIDFDSDSVLSGAGFQTLFIAQYDTSGHLNWLRLPQSDTVTNWSFSRTQLMDIDIDSQGNVYALCKFPPGSALSGTSLTIPAGPGTSGMYVLKYSASGMLQSVTQMDMRFNSSGANTVYLRRHPATGNYYVNGVLVPFAPYDDTLYLGNNRINTMMYVSCYSPAGALLWYRQNTYTGGLNNTSVQCGVQIDDKGDLYIAGKGAHGDSFNGFSFVNPLGTTVADVVPFVMKMNASGTPLWTSSGYSSPFSMTTQLALNNNKVAVGGAYGGLLVWNNDTLRNGTANGQDGWMAILDKGSGVLQHLDSIGGPSVYDGITAMHYHGSDLYVGGYFQSRIKAGNFPVYSNGGSSDFFLAKYGYSCGCTVPAASFTYQATGTSVSFTNTTTGQTDSLRWYFSNGQTSTQTNPTHNFGRTGSFTACLVAYNSCGKDSTCRPVNITTGLQHVPSVFPNVTLYPNPVRDAVFVDGSEEGMEWTCYELSGRLMLQKTLSPGSNKIDLSALPAGMYLIKIAHPDGRTAVERLIKM